MKRNLAAALLLVVQVALVASIAGKYLYERKTRPRVWVRAVQFDPNMALRGRYLALQLAVDACGLPHDQEHFTQGYRDVNGKTGPGTYRWKTSLVVQAGQLVPQLEDHARSPESVQELTQMEGRTCGQALLSTQTEFFIPDTAKTPFPLKLDEELWVEVTAPEFGPPRPIQLASSGSAGFSPLRFE